MRLIAIIYLASIAATAWGDGPLEITDRSLTGELATIQEGLDAVSAAVMGCIDTGKGHKACLCEQRSLIIAFNDSVNGLFLDHPELADLDLVSFKTADGLSVTQSLEGLRAQAGSQPSCP